MKTKKLKSYIKKLIPTKALPFTKHMYFMLKLHLSNKSFSKEDYSKLGCLKCLIRYNKYGAYCIPESSKHRFSAKTIMASRIHEPNTLELIEANSNGSVVHAGTYFGDFLPSLSKALTNDQSIYAFEPNKENYRCAQITMLLNDIHNVKLSNSGLGAETGVLYLETEDESGKPLGGASKITSDGKEEVIINTIDQSIPESDVVSVIQLDVEGHEIEALKGAIRTIRRCKPLLILEVWEGTELKKDNWFQESIIDYGYIKSSVVDGNHVYTYKLT